MYLYDFVIHLLYSDTLLPQIPSNSVNGDILSTKSVYCTLDCRIFMCNEPFVLSCQQAVLACLSCLKCKICIGSCRKYDYTLETAILYIAWRIMKCRLENFLDVPLKNYSSGMVARLAFAVATITKPDILIADEILSVGDFLFQEKCEKRMAELLSGGTTVILVSHSIDQIERMCNKVAWLDHGHLRRIGATKEITAEYRRFEKKDAMPAKVTEE